MNQTLIKLRKVSVWTNVVEVTEERIKVPINVQSH
jgi:hypothetical protein